MAKTKMQELLEPGQSVWLDYLSRGMTRSGELRSADRQRAARHDLEPHHLRARDRHHRRLRRRAQRAGLVVEERSPRSFETIAVEDVRRRPTSSARSTTRPAAATASCRSRSRRRWRATRRVRLPRRSRLWKAVDRPNVMIKIPGTREGWPAIEQCLREGININITLLFSVEHYEAVAEAYLRALEAGSRQGSRSTGSRRSRRCSSAGSTRKSTSGSRPRAAR